MIESLNHFSEYWADFVITASVQNSIYLIIIISILYLFREKNAIILRIIALFGLIKLFIPPFISSSLIQEFNIPTLTDYSLATLANNPLTDYTIGLSLQSKLMILWILIAILILVFSAFNTYRFRSNFRHAVLIDIRDHFSGPVHKNIQFYKSIQNHSPIVFGLFKIKIILPEDWDKWSSHQKRTVIIHELNHIKQLDHWINFLKLLAFSFHFFNPFVWIILKKLNELNELVCDDLTIAGTKTSNVDYTKQLLHFSESYSNNIQPIPSTLTFTESYRSLKIRLSYHLSKEEGGIMQNNNLKIRIAIIVCIVAMIPFLGQCNKEEPVSTSSDDAESISTGKMESKMIEYEDQIELTYSYDELTVKPELIHKELPGYPETARKNGIGGMVVVTVTIDESGNVFDTKIFSSENSALNEAALEAAKKCKFKPAEMDGQKVKASFNLPFKFALK